MREFKWCPAIAIKKCRGFFPVPHVHICISSVKSETTEPECGGPAIFLKFDDASDKSPKYDKLFDETMARRIADYVAAVSVDQLIVVNCEGGTSRSPGVVLALRRHYGGDTEEVFQRACPNIFVTSILSKVLREKTNS